jgi:hypothetical protein
MKKSYETNNLEILVDCLVRAKGQKDLALESARRILKSAVGSAASSDFDMEAASQYFRSTEQNPLGVFDRIKPLTKETQYRTRTYWGEIIVASTVEEGGAIGVQKYSAIDNSGLIPKKSAAIGVQTKDSLRTPEGISNFVAELTQGLTTAIDGGLLSAIGTNAATIITASPNAPLADLGAMQLGVSLTGYGQSIFAMGPALAIVLGIWRDSVSGQLLFPEMGPSGGILLNCQVIVTPALTDSIYLIDPSGIATGSEDLRIELSENTTLELDTEPTMDSVTPTGATGALISCFQADCIAVKGVRTWAAKLIRPSAVAVLTDIAWEGMPATTTTTSGA